MDGDKLDGIRGIVWFWPAWVSAEFVTSEST